MKRLEKYFHCFDWLIQSFLKANKTRQTSKLDNSNSKLMDEDAIIHDEELSSWIALKVSRELRLEGNNVTLGRKLIRLALKSTSRSDFRDQALDYGKLSKDLTNEIHHKTHQRVKSVKMQQQGNHNHSNYSSAEQLRLGTDNLPGGLVIPKKQRQPSSSLQKSKLGLQEAARTSSLRSTMTSRDRHEDPKRARRNDRSQSRRNPTHEEEWEKPERLQSSSRYEDTRKHQDHRDRRSDSYRSRYEDRRDSNHHRPSRSRSKGNRSESPAHGNNRHSRQNADHQDRIHRSTEDHHAPQIRYDDEVEEAFDRHFYLQDEEDPREYEDHYFLGSKEKFREFESKLERSKARGDMKVKHQSARKSALNADQEAWETNRLLTSGVVAETNVATEFNDEVESRVQIMVHNTKPPFLDGRVTFTTQLEMVSTVRDSTSDMAICAKKGSQLVLEVREERERSKMRKRFWEVGGSHMGNVLGVAKEEEADDNEEENRSLITSTSTAKEGQHMDDDETKDETKPGYNYKASSQFSSHMTKQKAVSQFAKSRTMTQQRQFLPIFQCRDELCQVIRDNQIIVIVGETGSGKTTQLTQVSDIQKIFRRKRY